MSAVERVIVVRGVDRSPSNVSVYRVGGALVLMAAFQVGGREIYFAVNSQLDEHERYIVRDAFDFEDHR